MLRILAKESNKRLSANEGLANLWIRVNNFTIHHFLKLFI